MVVSIFWVEGIVVRNILIGLYVEFTVLFVIIVSFKVVSLGFL